MLPFLPGITEGRFAADRFRSGVVSSSSKIPVFRPKGEETKLANLGFEFGLIIIGCFAATKSDEGTKVSRP